MPINHIVVLMLENRSFDHMLGFMKSPDWPINGLTGTESNFLDPLNPTGTPLPMKPDATYVPDVDPDPAHEHPNVVRQIHGAVPAPTPAKGSNIGFVADYATVTDAARAGRVMTGFADGKLPVIGTLAKEFAVCDNWFSSLPGPTWPNRFFVHCATAGGFVDGAVRNYPMRTLYENLSDARVNWRIYYHDVPQSLALQNQRKFFHSQYEVFNQSFVRDCKNGLLPQYSFIEPRYFNEGASRANDQHPIHGVVGGELLIADVYEALRASPNWNETLFIVTWDEHGGFYDHVPPPAATPPDPPNPAQQFDFASYGVRVPAIAISPLIPKATIERRLFDHSSIPATAKNVFKLPSFLTKRDAAANTLEHLCWLDTPRTDAPMTVPRPQLLARALQAIPALPEKPNDLQNELLALTRELGLPVNLGQVQSMSRAASADEAFKESLAHFNAFADRLAGKRSV
ncbi:MAG: alkaline phosphatase family protein [Candidatus Eremiobacteraeota bacterium]|nr:alkaline phosphatase family protein [Candidatus Eremiobacteraeota bacterium]